MREEGARRAHARHGDREQRRPHARQPGAGADADRRRRRSAIAAESNVEARREITTQGRDALVISEEKASQVAAEAPGFVDRASAAHEDSGPMRERSGRHRRRSGRSGSRGRGSRRQDAGRLQRHVQRRIGRRLGRFGRDRDRGACRVAGRRCRGGAGEEHRHGREAGRHRRCARPGRRAAGSTRRAERAGATSGRRADRATRPDGSGRLGPGLAGARRHRSFHGTRVRAAGQRRVLPVRHAGDPRTAGDRGGGRARQRRSVGADPALRRIRIRRPRQRRPARARSAARPAPPNFAIRSGGGSKPTNGAGRGSATSRHGRTATSAR